jgi:glutathione-regulated potassium-efflux system protein KefB
VLAIDNVEASLRTAQLVRQRYPQVPIYARARHRRHTHQLMDLGIKIIRRETFLSALELASEVLRGLGMHEREVRSTIDTFRAHDRRRLYENYKHYTDLEKLQARARTDAQELEALFAQDAAERAAEEAQEGVKS